MKTRTSTRGLVVSLVLVAVFTLATGCSLLGLGGPDEQVILDFDAEGAVADWETMTDQIMGGSSECAIAATDAGTAVFSGELKADNAFCFALARCEIEPLDVSAYDSLAVRFKGDGNGYAIALFNDPDVDVTVYQKLVETQPDVWETITIPFADLEATYHGQPADDAPPFDPASVVGVYLVTGGDESASFALELDWIKAVIAK